MQKLFINKEVDKDFDKVKNQKWTLVWRLFYRVVKENKFAAFLGTLIAIVVALVNGSLNHFTKNLVSNGVGAALIDEKRYHPYFNFLLKEVEFLGWEFNLLQAIMFYCLPLLILKAVLSTFHIYVNDYLSWKIGKDLKKDLFSHFVDAKYKDSSKVSSRIFTQFSSNIEGISDQIWIIPNRFVYVAISLSMNYFYELEDRSARTILPLSLTFFFLSLTLYYFIKKSTNEFMKLRRRNEENTKFLFERIRNLSHVKLSSSEELEKKKLESELESSFLENRKVLRFTVLLQGLSKYLLLPSIPFILTATSIKLSPKDIEGNTVKIITKYIQFSTYRSICGEVEKIITAIANIDDLTSELNIVNETVVELNSHELIDSKEMHSASFDGNIAFENVSFSYPLRPDIRVIENLNFQFEKNKKYGVAGKNGVGKSTITKIILKLFDISSGKVLVSGKDVKEIETRSFHDQICRLTNSPSFFNMSILENVLYPYGIINSNEEKNQIINILWEAAKKTRIDGFISSLPHGFDTVIREGGSDLSEGQKQQIEAMKVFVKPYEIYMFDEILSNVHPKTRELILEDIFKEIDGKTAIVIDHHYDIFKYMDEVYNFSRSELRKIDDLESIGSDLQEKLEDEE